MTALNEDHLRARASLRLCQTEIVVIHRHHDIDRKSTTGQSSGNTERMMRKMDFLIRVDVARAYKLPEDERAALVERERLGAESCCHRV